MTCLMMGTFAVLVGAPVARLFIRDRGRAQSDASPRRGGRHGRRRPENASVLDHHPGLLLQHASSVWCRRASVRAAHRSWRDRRSGGRGDIGVWRRQPDRPAHRRLASRSLLRRARGLPDARDRRRGRHGARRRARRLRIGAIAAFLIGIGTAGESDVVPYLLTKYFGLRSCSTLYGIAWIATALGAAGGPILLGRAFDASGSYTSMLIMFAFAIFAAAALMLTMPRYDRVRQPVGVGRRCSNVLSRAVPDRRRCSCAGAGHIGDGDGRPLQTRLARFWRERT